MAVLTFDGDDNDSGNDGPIGVGPQHTLEVGDATPPVQERDDDDERALSYVERNARAFAATPLWMLIAQEISMTL